MLPNRNYINRDKLYIIKILSPQFTTEMNEFLMQSYMLDKK